jgi:hypothetical protein
MLSVVIMYISFAGMATNFSILFKYYGIFVYMMKERQLHCIVMFGLIIYLVLVVGIENNPIIFGQIQNQNNLQYDAADNIPRTIDKIQCDKMEHLVFHNHTKLVIKVQNETRGIPGGIGIIPNDCIFWLHTHDESGIIHVESPIKQSFTLNQFLNIWKEFDNSSYPGYLYDNRSGNDMHITVDGNPVNSSPTDFDRLILKDNTIILINIGDNLDKG